MTFIIIVSIYCASIVVLIIGFARLKWKPVKDPRIHSISIVVPFRNEGSNIEVILESLSAIQYPPEKWEVIFVDDHSTEKINLPNHYRLLSSDLHGKKAAITTGVHAAKGEIIVTTDADCRVSPLWLRDINTAFQDPKIQMIVGGVRIQEDERFFSQLQALEFVSVAVTGAATLGLGLPTMCNGANLSYRREAFFNVGGYKGNEQISSGDDEFLMNKIYRLSKESIRYLYTSDSIVTSSHLHIFTSFIRQRLRWAGKWSANTSLTTRVVAVVVWLFHLSFVAMAFSALFGSISWKLFLILACAKAFFEALLLIPAAKFFGVNWRWISFIALQFVYSIYVITVGVTSQIFSTKWKDRAVATKV